MAKFHGRFGPWPSAAVYLNAYDTLLTPPDNLGDVSTRNC